MRNYPADPAVVAQLEIVRRTLSSWMIGTVRLVGLAAENPERAATLPGQETVDWTRRLLAELSEWQLRLRDWQALDLSPRLKAEIRILKAILDATIVEAEDAARQLTLID